MSTRHFRVRRSVQVDGQTATVGSASVEILFADSSGNVVLARGTTVPTGAGYAKGAIFLKTDAGDGTKGLYENVGTTSSANFNLVGEITGAEIGNGAVDSDQLANGILKYVDVTVTAAEIKALVATPKQLLAAAGANTAIVPVAVHMRLTAGSEVLAETDDNFVVEYAGGADIMTIETTGFIDQATDQNRYQNAPATLLTPVANEAVDLTVAAGEITGNASNDASLAVRLFYRVVPVL